MRRYDIMFATIDSLRSEESLRPGDPHSRAMVEFKEKEETERESVFTFSPRSRRPAPPRCCPKMTSAPMIKKSPEMIRSGAVALAGGSLRLPAGDWAATTSWWQARPPPGLQLPPPRLVMPLPDRREAEERGPGGPKCPPPSTAVGAPPRHKEPAIFHSFGFSQHRKNSSTQRFSLQTESQSQSPRHKVREKPRSIKVNFTIAHRLQR